MVAERVLAASASATATASATTPTTATAAFTALVVGTEIAELGAGGVLPRVLERHGLSVAVPTRRTDRHRLAIRGRLTPSLAIAAAVSVVVAHERERELASVVDVVDAHAHLVAEAQHVLDLVDALAPTELRDVQQAVLAGQHVHERAELRDVHDLAGVDGAEL